MVIQEDNTQHHRGRSSFVTATRRRSNSCPARFGNAEELRRPEPIEYVYNLMRQPVLRSKCWNEIAGLENEKRFLSDFVILPLLRPNLFGGSSCPSLLLFGASGADITFLGKALASRAQPDSFFYLTRRMLRNGWVGRGTRLLRAVFEIAGRSQPSIVFFDGIDTILSQWDAESLHLKEELLIQMKRNSNRAGNDQILVIGGMTRPQDLDESIFQLFKERVFLRSSTELNQDELKKYSTVRVHDSSVLHSVIMSAFDRVKESLLAPP